MFERSREIGDIRLYFVNLQHLTNDTIFRPACQKKCEECTKWLSTSDNESIRELTQPHLWKHRQNACFRDNCFPNFLCSFKSFQIRHNACSRDIVLKFFSEVTIWTNRFKHCQNACFRDLESLCIVFDCTLYMVFKMFSTVPKYHFKQRQNVPFYCPCFEIFRWTGPLSHAPSHHILDF